MIPSLASWSAHMSSPTPAVSDWTSLVGHVRLRGAAHDPRAPGLEHLLHSRPLLMVADVASANDEVGLMLEDGQHQALDVRAAVLVVGVGVDDHVRAELEGCVDACLEG